MYDVVDVCNFLCGVTELRGSINVFNLNRSRKFIVYDKLSLHVGPISGTMWVSEFQFILIIRNLNITVLSVVMYHNAMHPANSAKQ